MKKKEKELTKKARKQIRLSLEELLTEEIKKVIVGQGRNPKKAAKEIKKSVSLIAKTLAQKESLSQPAEEDSTSASPEIRERIKSFDVPAIPAPEIPSVPEEPVAKVKRVRKAASPVTAEAEATPILPARRGRKAASPVTAESEATPVQPVKRARKATSQAAAKVEATPVRPVRKRTPRKPVVVEEPAIEAATDNNVEAEQTSAPTDQNETDL